MVNKPLQLVLVTPERTLLDEPADALRFPLFDGQIGILPSRAPMVGRLGFGELRIQSAAGEKRFYIDGGFAQITGNVVSLLTNNAVPLEELDRTALASEFDEISARRTSNEIDQAAKLERQERLRKMLSLAQ